jgi:hypothetical protein
MLIKSFLFMKGHPLKGESGLSDLLDAHKRRILHTIRSISDLAKMTDSYLEKLVKDSLVEPLNLQFDKQTKKLRTEQFDGAELPFEQCGERGRRYPRQVARLSIPFTGDRKLPDFSPIPTPSQPQPRGEVYGSTIQFDLVLWGSPDDAQRVKADLQKNCESLAVYAAAINQQVKEFNESLPAQVKTAFKDKLEELTKQYAIFDDLGIPEEPEPPQATSTPTPAKKPFQKCHFGSLTSRKPWSFAPPRLFETASKPRTVKAQVVHITQYVENQYVQQLKQINYNTGDVNNAIQSGE